MPRLLLAAAILAAMVPAQGPVRYGANYYEFVQASGITWHAAAASAASRVHRGVAGHLVTIGSAGENAFVASLATQPGGFIGGWIGATTDASARGTWTFGPEAGLIFSVGQTPYGQLYANWGGIEPNNNPGFAYMNLGTSAGFVTVGQWLDDDNGTPSSSDPILGYFVEYELWTPVTASAVAASPVLVQAGAAVDARNAGTDLTNLTLEASDGISIARSVFSLRTTSQSVRYSISESCRFISGLNYPTSYGLHETLLTLTSAMPIAGTLRVQYSRGSAPFVGISGDAGVDVNNDGSFDWNSTPGLMEDTWEMALVLSGSVAVRTRSSGTAPILAYLDGNLMVEFVPTPIYDNGPLVTHPAAGFGGHDASVLQDQPPLQLDVLAFANVWVVDDFVVGDQGFVVSEVEIYCCETGATTTPPGPVTGLYAEFFDELGTVPNSPSQQTDLLAFGGACNWTGIYRTRSADIGTATDHAIFSVRANLPAPLSLPPGTYRLLYRVSGGLASMLYPPITVWNQGRTGNGLHAFLPCYSGSATPYAQGFPFRLFGVRPMPAGNVQFQPTGCGNCRLTMAGPPVVGGFVRAEVSNLSPGGVPVIGLSFVSAATPFCGCTLGHSWTGPIVIGSSWSVTVPLDPGYWGLAFYCQAAEFFSTSGCTSPAVAFTDTAEVSIR